METRKNMNIFKLAVLQEQLFRTYILHFWASKKKLKPSYANMNRTWVQEHSDSFSWKQWQRNEHSFRLLSGSAKAIIM